MIFWQPHQLADNGLENSRLRQELIFSEVVQRRGRRHHLSPQNAQLPGRGHRSRESSNDQPKDRFQSAFGILLAGDRGGGGLESKKSAVSLPNHGSIKALDSAEVVIHG